MSVPDIASQARREIAELTALGAPYCLSLEAPYAVSVPDIAYQACRPIPNPGIPHSPYKTLLRAY
eukprot:2202962-Rhodomonas_salina.2